MSGGRGDFGLCDAGSRHVIVSPIELQLQTFAMSARINEIVGRGFLRLLRHISQRSIIGQSLIYTILGWYLRDELLQDVLFAKNSTCKSILKTHKSAPTLLSAVMSLVD